METHRKTNGNMKSLHIHQNGDDCMKRDREKEREKKNMLERILFDVL